MKKVIYGIDIKRVMRGKLVLGIADGWLSADGNVIYKASDLKVGLFKQEPALQPTGGLIGPVVLPRGLARLPRAAQMWANHRQSAA